MEPVLRVQCKPYGKQVSCYKIKNIYILIMVTVQMNAIQCLYRFSWIDLFLVTHAPFCNLRCVLLLALIVCRGGSFLLEQPQSSLMAEYFRFQWLCRILKAPLLTNIIGTWIKRIRVYRSVYILRSTGYQGYQRCAYHFEFDK